MIFSIVYPSSAQYTGGVVALYEYANGLARRGHEVHLVHGPAWPGRIDRVEELDWFRFEPSVVHHVVDDLDDPSLPEGDVVHPASAPRRLGLPVSFLQGHGMLPAEMEREAIRARCPKICVAGWLVDVGRSYGVPDEQLWHVPMGLDHDRFRPPEPALERTIDVLVLHNPHPAKGWVDGLAALEAVRARRPELVVRAFAIRPPDEPLPDWIDLEVAPDRDRLARELYGRAEVFLQPSVHEGFGYSAVEAMACGAALVTTDNGGSSDYAVPGETALVVPPRDVAAMASAVEDLLADPERRERLAAAGERYVRRFDWDLAAEALEAHLEAYLADPASGQAEPGPERDVVPPGVAGGAAGPDR